MPFFETGAVDRQTPGHLLPTRYFHLVFTIPDHLNPLFCLNQETCYALLFKAAWMALNQGCQNPDFLGADTGAVAVLHTWTQTLIYHPHVHLIVPGGGLSEDGMEWISARKKYLVRLTHYPGCFGNSLAVDPGKNRNRETKDPEKFPGVTDFKKRLYQNRWNVYAKPAFNGIVGF